MPGSTTRPPAARWRSSATRSSSCSHLPPVKEPDGLMPVRPIGLSSMTVGDVRLTLLPDGYHRCDPVKSFVGSTAADWDAHDYLLDEQGRAVMTMGALLAELPDGSRVLIDVGFGPRTVILAELAMEFWGGRLLASLAAVGLTRRDVDVVVYSHLHTDHVGWTTDRTRGTLTFDRARHVMARAEWEYWRGDAPPRGPHPHHNAPVGTRGELLHGGATPGARRAPAPTP